jgi:hypothetical protein
MLVLGGRREIVTPIIMGSHVYHYILRTKRVSCSCHQRLIGNLYISSCRSAVQCINSSGWHVFHPPLTPPAYVCEWRRTCKLRSHPPLTPPADVIRFYVSFATSLQRFALFWRPEGHVQQTRFCCTCSAGKQNQAFCCRWAPKSQVFGSQKIPAHVCAYTQFSRFYRVLASQVSHPGSHWGQNLEFPWVFSGFLVFLWLRKLAEVGKARGAQWQRLNIYIYIYVYIYIYILSVTRNDVIVSVSFLCVGWKRKRNGDGNGKETETETVKKRWKRKRNGKETVKKR